ncbi:MAG: T9SS type A sorting domain-containing protein [Arcticibacter sp.]
MTLDQSQADPDVHLLRRELPKPHPGTDRQLARNAKAQLEHFRQDRVFNQGNKSGSIAPAPVMYRNFLGNGFNGYVPNDNDIAVSNGDMVCSVSNSNIWSRNLTTNMTYGSYTLHSISSSLGLQQEEFDPKVFYDPQQDRFVVLFLNGFTDSTSNIVVGFSQTNQSNGAWNFYALPGDPLNNNLWTDYPMMSITDDELFITVNLLSNDSTWQAGFNETIIWQIPKVDGFQGSTINPTLHSGINYNGQPLRNLCPVKGGSTLHGPNMYFLSNRNFSTGNDTIFLVEISGTAASNPTISVSPMISNIRYRMPLDAAQPFQDMLIVNDARAQGAFLENNQIQFVFNTLDTVSGKTGIYHGQIDLTGSPTLNGNIHSIDTLYLGYPNIAYAGIGPGDNRSIISTLLSSSTFQPGVGAILSDGNGSYSPVTVVKQGLSYTNMLNGNERWGDYTGCQTRYNLPGWVWVNGSYSLVNHTTRTWIGELTATSGVSVPELNTNKYDANIYPNPTSERTEIQFDLKADDFISLEVLDLNGKLIKNPYRGSLRSGLNSISINTAFLSKGTYVIQINSRNSGLLASKRLVIQ